MPNLRELQKLFSKVVSEDSSESKEATTQLQNLIEEQGELSAGSRLKIYQKNSFFSLYNTLSKIYRQTKYILGDDKFRSFAKEYIRIHPSNTQSLNLYGADFAPFLEQSLSKFKPQENMTQLLASLSKFEWLYNKSYFAETCPPFDYRQLQKLNELELENLIIGTVPSLFVIESCFNLNRIWHEPETWVDNSSNGAKNFYFAIVKKDQHVLISDIDKFTYAVLLLVSQGKSLAQIAVQFPNQQQEALAFLLKSLELGYVTCKLTI